MFKLNVYGKIIRFLQQISFARHLLGSSMAIRYWHMKSVVDGGLQDG